MGHLIGVDGAKPEFLWRLRTALIACNYVRPDSPEVDSTRSNPGVDTRGSHAKGVGRQADREAGRTGRLP
ncbi:hypothetical protein ACQP0C_13520 [Nocardia sp. CA-129566]|uniref:hypothetical protein n=1 Tax=Nocardia sp. CA-129566 TaxID=3239976 RepID=UPI003D99FC27